MVLFHRLFLFMWVPLVLALPSHSQGLCPNNWIYLHGSCYKFSTKTSNFNAAKSTCKAQGSKLAMVKSQEQNQAITSRLTKAESYIGLYRDPKDPSKWLWVDGTRASYTNWDKGQPNNKQANIEDCVVIWKSGVWHDAPCNNQNRYYSVCETEEKCEKLSLGSGVRVSPSDCVSSNQAYGTTCSFSCASGYQLNGPSSTQCGKGGSWSQKTSTVRCLVVKCPALTISGLVKTAPNSCLTSQMKFNTNCSFSCPQGFHLQGPSYKQCGSRGQWTDSAKTVTCIDINECAVSNGGCSHKCANTAGGYKCECPDPELSLAADNKSCQAPGVNVQCNSENMTIIIPKPLLRGMDREHLRLLDTTCKATETDAYFSLTTPLTSCNTTSRHAPTAIVYSNAVLEVPVAAEDVVTRVREVEIQFSCFYSKYGVVSSVGWKPNDRKLVFSDVGDGNFTLSLDMFPDKRFASPYTKSDFPVAVVLRKRLFFEVSVASDDKQLSIRAGRCFATPSLDQKNPLKYEFISNGCPTDTTFKHHSAPAVSAQRFSLEAFKFIADHPFVFVHCHVIVCNATDPGSKCAKSCSLRGRGRREVSDHVTDVYSLAQGPLHLAREKREEGRSSGLDKNSSSTTIIMALFVMCVAVLAGTAVMSFKRSREPVGYAVLASGDQN